MNKARIAVFVSGGGTNLQALLDAERDGILRDGEIVLVVADKPGIGAIDRATKHGVPITVISRKEEDFEEETLEALRAANVDMIVLAGFLGILSASFLERFAGPVINVHPSLIPSFCGKGFYGLRVHEAALDYGVKVTGATVHYVNEIPDGGEIILQKSVKVEPHDTPQTLQRRVMEEAEWIILPQAAQMVAREIAKEKYMYQDIFAYLSNNSYPGRGILLGKSVHGDAIVAYFIMGRSESSRSRAFVLTEDGLRVAPLDLDKIEDPSLLVYHPVRRDWNGCTVVTNGDQTETIMEALDHDKDWTEALRERTFEPDAPNWTPRISGVVRPNGSYTLSILKTTDGDPASCSRYFFEYENPAPGTAHFISTYRSDGDPLPSFEGEPLFVSIPQTNAEDLLHALWDALDHDNRVSLYVAFVNMDDESVDEAMRNAYDGDIVYEEGDVADVMDYDEEAEE